MKFLFLSCIFLNTSIAFSELSEPEKLTPILEEAKIEMKSGNYRNASKLFKKIYFKSDRLKNEALIGLISSFQFQKKWDDAIEYLNEELKKNPFKREYRILISQIYTESGDFSKALEEINYAEKLLEGDPEALKLKFVLLKKLQRNREAISTINQLVINHPNDYNTLADRGESFINEGLFKEAYKDLSKAYEIRPFDEKILSLFTKTSYLMENHNEVKKIGQECLKLFPQNITCLEYSAKSFYKKKFYSAASTNLKTALLMDSKRTDLLQLYAECLAAQENFSESDEQFEKLLSLSPKNEDAIRSWTQILLKRKNLELLGTILLRFNKENPDHLWSSIQLSKLLLTFGEKEQSISKLKALSHINDSPIAQVYYSYILYSAEKYTEARSILVQQKESKFDVDFYLATIFFKESKLDEAITHWLKVPPSSDLYKKSLINSALAFEKQNNPGKAIEILSQIKFTEDHYDLILRKIEQLKNSQKRVLAQSNENQLSYFLEWDLPDL